MINQNIQLSADKPAIWLIFNGDKLLQFVEQPGLLNCAWQQLGFAHAYQEQIVQIGDHDGQACFMIDMGNELVNDAAMQAISLRAMIMQSDLALFGIASRAWQITLFMRTHKFCGQCGSTMQQIDWEMAMQCSRCKHRCYPRISPCIIVAIRKQDKILLAQGKPHKSRQMFSTLAGFVESGETLEQAVHREVFEEVAIKVKNLRYFASQPWPFPHSLMVGFLADYDSGDIQVDGHEIFEAGWFPADNLPAIPPKFSIAGQLIAATLAEIKNPT